MKKAFIQVVCAKGDNVYWLPERAPRDLVRVGVMIFNRQRNQMPAATVTWLQKALPAPPRLLALPAPRA